MKDVKMDSKGNYYCSNCWDKTQKLLNIREDGNSTVICSKCGKIIRRENDVNLQSR